MLADGLPDIGRFPVVDRLGVEIAAVFVCDVRAALHDGPCAVEAFCSPDAGQHNLGGVGLVGDMGQMLRDLR